MVSIVDVPRDIISKEFRLGEHNFYVPNLIFDEFTEEVNSLLVAAKLLGYEIDINAWRDSLSNMNYYLNFKKRDRSFLRIRLYAAYKYHFGNILEKIHFMFQGRLSEKYIEVCNNLKIENSECIKPFKYARLIL